MNITAETLTRQSVRRRRKYWRYGPHRIRVGFRRWRRSRPFWGGLFAILGGAMMTLGPVSAYKVILTAGDVVWEGILVGVLVSICGLFIWFQPGFRHFFGVLTALLSVLSFITSDIGGFVIGMLLGITGGAMAFAWVPVDRSMIKPHVWQRHERAAWKARRRTERAARRRALDEELTIRERQVPELPPEATVPVRGVPAEEPAATDPVAAEPPATEPAVIETVGQEVERLPEAKPAVTTGAQPEARPQQGRRFHFPRRRS